MQDNILLPQGFTFSGIASGIKENKSLDLGLVYCKEGGVVGAVYTKNMFPAAPVMYCQELTPSKNFHALLINSGNANAGTGTKGIAHNKRIADFLAKKLQITQNSIFISSTGIIGKQLPVVKIEQNIPFLIQNLSTQVTPFSYAILTTDTKPKVISRSFQYKNTTYTILGVAKGSGMINPNMATMLAYIFTDCPLDENQALEIAKKTADKSFNRISIDSDTSTNDTYMVISSQKNYSISPTLYQHLHHNIETLSIELAKQLVLDGEGVNHLIEVEVKRALTQNMCDNILSSVINSPLVKTAIHGNDANWGRILMAVGNGLINTITTPNIPVEIYLQNTLLYQNCGAISYDETMLSEKMKEKIIKIEIDLMNGNFSGKSWGCDLSKRYIEINAEYTT